MTIAQIMAVLSLLLAFGVDQPTVNNVEAILKQNQKPAIVQSLGATIKPMSDTQHPVVGTNSDGQTVYKGTGFYIIDSEGCHWSVQKTANGFSNAIQKVWCPAQ